MGDNTTLPTEKAVRDAINSGVTADNGVRENPDGNIQLGGDLLIATEIGVEAGTTLKVSDAAEATALLIDENGNIAAGNGTITTGTGQVTLGGNVNANSGVDVTGLLQADDNVTLGATNSDALVVNATADFNDVLNVDGATTLNNAVTVADGATTTSINNNTINLGNSATDAITVNGITNLTGGNVTVGTNLTLATGATVNDITTVLDAVGDNTTLPTEKAVRDAINSGVTADNGVRENPDGNIQLGGDLIIATDIGVESGTTLKVSDAAEATALLIDESGNISTGNGTVTTGTGQVTIGGNVNANSGVDVTGALQADDNVTLGATNADALVVNATADFNDVLNVDGATTLNSSVTVADGATTTSINNNTINLGNSATDAITVNGITNLTGGNVTVGTNLTLATGATVNDITTVLDAVGDNTTLPTEKAVRDAINSGSNSRQWR